MILSIRVAIARLSISIHVFKVLRGYALRRGRIEDLDAQLLFLVCYILSHTSRYVVICDGLFMHQSLAHMHCGDKTPSSTIFLAWCVVFLPFKVSRSYCATLKQSNDSIPYSVHQHRMLTVHAAVHSFGMHRKEVNAAQALTVVFHSTVMLEIGKKRLSIRKSEVYNIRLLRKRLLKTVTARASSMISMRGPLLSLAVDK